jgi:hypothetical protein
MSIYKWQTIYYHMQTPCDTRYRHARYTLTTRDKVRDTCKWHTRRTDTACDNTRHCTKQHADDTRNNVHDSARVSVTTRMTCAERCANDTRRLDTERHNIRELLSYVVLIPNKY